MDKVTLLDEGQDADIHVSWQDQEKINRFSQLNITLGEAEIELAEWTTGIEALEDANTDLELACGDDDLFDELEDELADDVEEGASKPTAQRNKAKVPYRLGDAFFMFTSEQAKEMLHRDLKQLKTQQLKRKDEVEKMKAEMKDLKKALYTRFGKAIQLEA